MIAVAAALLVIAFLLPFALYQDVKQVDSNHANSWEDYLFLKWG